MVLCLPIFRHLNLNPGTLILGGYHWWLSWHCVDQENLTPCSDIQWTLPPSPGKTWSMSKCSTLEPVFWNDHRKMQRWYQITSGLRALFSPSDLLDFVSALDPWSLIVTHASVMHVSMMCHFCYERTDKVGSIYLRMSCAITSRIPPGGFCFLIVQ